MIASPSFMSLAQRYAHHKSIDVPTDEPMMVELAWIFSDGHSWSPLMQMAQLVDAIKWTLITFGPSF